MIRISKLLLLSAALCFGACQNGSGPRIGSETHFLVRCDTDAACGEDLACVCGACTSSCSATASCEAVTRGAECISLEARPPHFTCGEISLSASCELTCASDEQCRGLDEAARCDRGFCRRPSGQCETGPYAPDDIIILGDRYLAESGLVAQRLAELSRAAGAWGADQPLRDYSSGLVSPFGGSDDLFKQYATAQADGQHRVAILNVGGPDALLACDVSTDTLCPSLQTAVDGARELLLLMNQTGTERIFLFFYPTPNDPLLASNFDRLRPLLEQECQASATPCDFLDLRPIIDPHRDVYLDETAVFPTTAGSDATAGALFGLLELHCVLR